jgi:hypothetical protein
MFPILEHHNCSTGDDVHILIGPFENEVSLSDANLMLHGASSFGHTVAGGGEVDGDGASDVRVGAPSAHDAHTDEGDAYLFLNSSM